MKRIVILLYLTIGLFACNDNWNEHYNKAAEDENISSLTLYEYLQGEADYSQFFNLMKNAAIDQELSKDQYLTVWVVKNANIDASTLGAMDPNEIIKYHVNYLALGATDLKHGQRVRSLSGIYITVKKSGDINFANDSKILSSKRFKNGVVHEIESLMMPRVNLFDYILNLPDDYSTIRDTITRGNKLMFDMANSRPVGVDPTGNTIYDSVFYIYNPMFDKADLSSEFNQFTLFIPNNEVINNTLVKLASQYQMMGKKMGLADTLLAMSWIKNAVVHVGMISNYHEKVDYTSAFSKVWRSSVQKVDETPMELSNGLVYNVTELKIPNNVLITRIKSLVHYYEYLDSLQQKELYTLKGTMASSIFKGDVTPVSGFYYWLFQAEGDTVSADEFSVEFTPLGYDSLTGKAYVMKVPPGEYNFYMGFQSKGHPFVDIFVQTGSGVIGDDALPLATEIPAVNSNPWNYDRVTETDPKISKWNGLGGFVGKITITGDEMSTFRVKVKFNKPNVAGGVKRIRIYHWALKPTENNY